MEGSYCGLTGDVIRGISRKNLGIALLSLWNLPVFRESTGVSYVCSHFLGNEMFHGYLYVIHSVQWDTLYFTKPAFLMQYFNKHALFTPKCFDITTPSSGRKCNAKYLYILKCLHFYPTMLSISYLLISTWKAVQTDITSFFQELICLRVRQIRQFLWPPFCVISDDFADFIC